MAVLLSSTEFDDVVEEALAQIPANLMSLVTNCVVLVEDDAPHNDRDLLGLYDGIPLTERDSSYAGVLPDRIFIFRNNLMQLCESREELVSEIRITVVHEVAHFFGIDDDRLHELGYD